MEWNQNTAQEGSNRPAGLMTLAVVGFVALVLVGMYLAVYSARFVPGAVSRIGAAAVALTSVFTPAPHAGLAVIPPEASTTIPFGQGDGSSSLATSSTSAPVKHVPVATRPGTETSATIPVGGTGVAAYSGLPDLVVTINAVGYLSNTNTASFVAAAIVPHGSRPAVKFTIKNNGTNVAGPWRFSASIPTSTVFIYQSTQQQLLNPGDSIDYTLGFDQATIGANQTISISTNFDHAISESNTSNNNASASVTVQ